MAKINISYDCSDLINELKMDLEEFGAESTLERMRFTDMDIRR